MKVCCALFDMSMLLAVVAPGAACSTSVHVDNVPQAPSLGDTTTQKTIPGLPNAPFPTPVDLSNGECPQENVSDIIAWGSDPNINPSDPNKKAPPPNMGNAVTGPGLILYWTICNDGTVAQPSGSTYEFFVKIQPSDSGLPPKQSVPPVLTVPPTQVTLRVPPLPGCTCFVQEVGVNTPVPDEAHNQENIAKFGDADVLFPMVTLPKTQASTPDPSGKGTLTFQYDASLSQFGVGDGFFQLL